MLFRSRKAPASQQRAAAGFTVSNSSSTVLGFSFTGAVIPSGCGTLTNLNLAGDADGLVDIIVSDASGNSLDFSYFDDSTSDDGGCDDEDGDGICDDVDDCVGVYDECDVCNGDGIADGACDCDGNVEDCAGDCGGSSELDECGVCNGDGYLPNWDQDVPTYIDSLRDADAFDWVPMNWNEQITAQVKLSWRVTPRIKMSFNRMFSDNRSQYYSHLYKWNPDGRSNYFNTRIGNLFRMDLSLSQSTFANIMLSQSTNHYRNHLSDDPDFYNELGFEFRWCRRTGTGPKRRSGY